MSINFVTFNKIVTSQVASQNIPNLMFNPTSSLGMAIDRLSSNIDTKDKSIPEIISGLIKNMNDPIYRNEMSTIKNIIMAYTNSINNSFNYLRFIKESVDSLKNKIEEETNNIASHSEVITNSNFVSNENYKTQFTMVPWEDINKFATPTFIVEQLQNTLGVFQNTSPIKVAFNKVNNTILFNSFIKYLSGSEIDDITINEEAKEKLISTCHDKTDMTRDNINSCINIITDRDRLNRWANTSLNKINSPDIITTIEDINDISRLSRMISSVEKDINEILNLSDEQIIQLNKNIKLVNDVLYYKYFFVNVQRNDNYNRLIFDTHLINPDALTDFVKAGYDTTDISKFVYRRMQNSQPFKGVYTEAVIKSIENVRKEIENDKQSLNRLATLELNDIRKRSFIRHMNEFMDVLVEEPKISNIPRYIEHMANDINYLNGDLESAIYGVIINVEFPNTIVQTMYEKLGKAYMNVLSNSSNQVSLENMQEAEMNVIISMIVDHIVDKLVDDVK